jgi:hypothetical protein
MFIYYLGVRVNIRNNYQENALFIAIDEGLDLAVISMVSKHTKK